jgi:hypothetical protein
MTPTTQLAGQLTLPLSRDERLHLIGCFRRMKLAIIGGKMRANLAGLLEALELNAGSDGCRISRGLLAAKLAINVTTLNRWLRICGEFGLVEKAPRYLNGGKGRQAENLIRIDWYCVRRLVCESLPPRHETLFGGCAFDVQAPDVRAGGDDGETNVHGEADCAHGETSGVHGSAIFQSVPPRVAMDCGARHNSAATGDANAPPGGALLPARGGAKQQNAPPMVNGTFLLKKDVHGRFIAADCGEPCARTIDPILCLSKDPISSVPLGAQNAELQHQPDRCELSLELLRSPEGVQRWFEFALARGWVRQVDRLRVFTAAQSVVRRATRKGSDLANPCGAFVRLVKRQLWRVASQEDEDQAAQAIRLLEGLR